jgi:hypothetical protein
MYTSPLISDHLNDEHIPCTPSACLINVYSSLAKSGVGFLKNFLTCSKTYRLFFKADSSTFFKDFVNAPDKSFIGGMLDTKRGWKRG